VALVWVFKKEHLGQKVILIRIAVLNRPKVANQITIGIPATVPVRPIPQLPALNHRRVVVGQITIGIQGVALVSFIVHLRIVEQINIGIQGVALVLIPIAAEMV
jgi:hypothetical protein